MARLSNGPIATTTTGSTDRPRYDGSDNSIPQNGEVAQSAEQIRERIKQSSIYRAAYVVFSAESDKYWLNQLQSILDSVIGVNSTFWDDIGASNAGTDKIEAIYQEAINNIRTLYNQYQSYKNSLPVTQVQQLANAGINSAITGNGVSGSELSQSDIASGASSMPSTNAGEYISQVANFALSASQGLMSTLKGVADTVLAFRGQSLQRDQFQFSKEQFAQNKRESFNQFKSALAKDGVILFSSSWDELDSKDPNWNDNASSQAQKLYNDWKLLDNTYTYGPQLSAFGSIDNDLRSDFKSIGKMQLALRLNEIKHHSARRNIQMPLELTEDGIKEFELNQRKSDAEYQAFKAQTYLSRMTELVSKAKEGNIVAEVQLINMLDNADWQESFMYVLGEDFDWKAIGSMGDTLMTGINTLLDYVESDVVSPVGDKVGDFLWETSPIGYPVTKVREWLKNRKSRK